MKIYDFDGMFDQKLSDYISKNAQKYKEEEWEDIIPRLYNKFGDTVIKGVGKSPRGFFADMEEGDLIRCLKTYISNGVPVPEFLCSEIESRHMEKKLMPLLDAGAVLRDYAINLIGPADAAIKKYLQILVSCSDEELKNRCVDFIKEKADLVVPEALGYYNAGTDKEYMLEIISRSVIKDERIFNILLTEFRTDPDNIPMHASYLAAYGDERALPYLLDKIDEEGISFIEYKELKFAIEALGGEYTKERDFSSDPYYAMFKNSADLPDDIFSVINKKDD